MRDDGNRTYTPLSPIPVKTRFVDWFDPHDIDHLKAWKNLNDEGFWPKGFIPDDVEMHTGWQMAAYAKMADCWLQYALSTEAERNG